MADIDFSLLDVPRDAPPEDPETFLRTAMAWHFRADTGSPFWLRAAKSLDFDPLTDVQTFADLRRFPNLVDELRGVPVDDLIPRGYGSPAPIPRIFESGGTTGAPKRTAQLPDWVEQVTRWQVEDFTAGGFVSGGGLACPDAEWPARGGPFRPGGRRTPGVGVPPDRHGSTLGQEARRPKRDVGDHRLCRPCAGAGDAHLADPGSREPACHTAVGGSDRPRRPSGRSRQRQGPLPAAQWRTRGHGHARPASPDLPEHRYCHGVRKHDGAVAGGHSYRRRRVHLRPALAVHCLLRDRSGDRCRGAVRRARPGGDEPHQQGHVHPEQPGT